MMVSKVLSKLKIRFMIYKIIMIYLIIDKTDSSQTYLIVNGYLNTESTKEIK
jgi:hypothetical protein